MVKFTTVIHLVVVCIQLCHTCKISEFSCRNNQLCLPLDRYCDGRDDCGDKSDEPKGCTGEWKSIFGFSGGVGGGIADDVKNYFVKGYNGVRHIQTNESIAWQVLIDRVNW